MNYEEKNFENAIEFFKSYLEADKVKIANYVRLSEINSSYEALKEIIDKGDDTSIEILPDALDLGDVSIRIVTPTLTIYNISLFLTVVIKADNIEIYPTADDRIKIDIQFRNAYYVSLI